MKIYFAVSLLVAPLPLLSVCRSACAQEEASDVAKAKALQVDGLKLLDKGNAAAALVKFNEAYEIVPSAKVLFNQGRAHEALGHDLDALAAYENFLRSPNMPQAAREDAQRRVDKLHTRVAFLSVTGPTGADVLLDGAPKGKLPFEGTLAMAPGPHELRLQRDTQELFRQSLDARPGATINVNVVVQTQTTVREPSPSVNMTPPQPSETPTIAAAAGLAEEPQPQAWMRPTTWAVAGVGTAALVLGGIQQWRSNTKADNFNSYTQAPFTADGRCGKRAPQSGGGQCQSFLDASASAQNVALGAFIAGGVLVVGAATLFLLSPRSTTPEPSLSFTCAPNFFRPGADCSATF